jgi:anthranilate 1,2-dioxygenase (deaminating, decarboxylating) large subunit
MKYSPQFLFVAGLALAALLVGPAAAFDQPGGLNLGATSFLDGIPPAGPGLYFTEYVQYYTADTLSDLPVPNPDIELWVSLNQFVYQSNQTFLFGGKWGLDVIVPLVSIDSQPLPDNGAGLGDVYVGPFLQWDPIMGEKGPVFVHRVELQTIWPTGKYDNEKALNPGSNYFSFDPYWAFTWFFMPKAEVSARIHYLWNEENEDPFIGSGAMDSTQAGQAWHANFAASYEVLPKQLRVGVNGYYLKQFESSQVDGDKKGLKEEVFAVGPGALWSFSPDTHLFFNAYFETDTQARPEGERVYLRLVHHF